MDCFGSEKKHVCEGTKMDNSKTIYILDGMCGTFYLDHNGEIIQYVHENDGCWHDSMTSLVDFLGGAVKQLPYFKNEKDVDSEEEFIKAHKKHILQAIKKANK